MNRLLGITGFICGIAAGLLMLLNNPLSRADYPIAVDSEAYTWRSLEFFGVAFTPAELLGLSDGSLNRSLGAKEVKLTSASIILLQDEAGQPAALATRLTSINKSSDAYAENLGVDTYTNIFWANAGSILMHGYEDRWPLMRDHYAAGLSSSGDVPGDGEFQVSAERPDREPTGIAGGSGLFSAIGGRYSETIKRDPDQPDLYAGTVLLDISVR